MNFNFSAWAIRNPVPPILLFFVLALLGIMSFRTMAVEKFPNIDFPLIAVSVGQSGATPAELEAQITKVIEDSVAGVSGVKHISSDVSDGNSQTLVEFRLEVPTTKALDDVKDAVAKVRSNLPGGVDEPIIQSIDVVGQSIQTYAVSAPAMTLEQLSWYVDDVVKRQLQGLPGIGRVERFGGVNREIRIDLDPVKLQAYGITAASVNQQLAATNADTGAGRGGVGGIEQTIRTLGGAKSITDLKATKITLSGGRDVKLSDIADVRDSSAEQRSFASYNGDGVVAFSIFRAKGASSTEVGDRVGKKIEELTSAGKGAVTFSLVDDTVYFIYGNYTAAMETLLEGAILAVIVVLIFLRDWRATLISAIALPLSAIPTFWVMQYLGFSLNLVSFLGLNLATGILVDDAIVEIENISRHMRMGKSAYRASLEAADEIGLAVIAISLTIVAVFVPVSFMGGIVGQYFKQFGMTVAVAVLFSLLVARLITPMMAAYLMRHTHHEEPQPGILIRGYARLLRMLNWGPTTLYNENMGPSYARHWANAGYALAIGALFGFAALALKLLGGLTAPLAMPFGFVAAALIAVFAVYALGLLAIEHKNGTRKWARTRVGTDAALAAGYHKGTAPRFMSYLTMIGSFALVFSSTLLFPYLPTGFIPKGDESRFVLAIELPPGSKLEETGKVSEQIADIVREHEEVSKVIVVGGSSPTGTLDTRLASIYVNLKYRDVHLVNNMWNPIASRLGLPQREWEGRVKPQWQVEEEIFPKLASMPDIRWFKVQENGQREVAFNLLSNDSKALNDAAARLQTALREDGRLIAPVAEGALLRPEIQIVPKTAEAAKLGITAQQISQTVRVATIGDFSPLLAKFSIDGRQIPIRVQIPEKARASFSELSNLRVITDKGISVPLATVADINLAEGPSSIKRYDRERQATLGADLPKGIELGDAIKIIEDTATKLNLPSSVNVQKSADAEIQEEVNTEFVKAAGIGVILMLAVLVLLLGNVFMPFAILLSLPLSIGGVVLALWFTNNAFSMPVTIGMLMLIGIVAKNAIMLIDFAVERRKGGMERIDAIIDSGRKRARPIVMTTIAMAAGMLPSAFGIGEGGAFRAPMAIAVIGGLIVSTFLSLLFVPSFYVVMDDLARLTRWTFSRFAGARDEPAIVNDEVESVRRELSETTSVIGAINAKLESVEDRIAEVASSVTKKPKLKVAAE
jgi:multidrug efflux pump subunit AcrB